MSQIIDKTFNFLNKPNKYGSDHPSPSTMVNADATFRHVWIKVTPKAGFTLPNNEQYYDITDSSEIQLLNKLRAN